MGEQRRLAALESFQQEGPPQLIKIAIRLGSERFLEVQSTRESSIDLVRVHMLAEHDADVGHPRQFLDGAAHVVSHQKREICRTPISRQTKFDVDAIVGVHIGPRDEFERGDQLVQLRVGHCFQPPPDLGFTVGGDASLAYCSLGGVDGFGEMRVSARRLDLLLLGLSVDAIQSSRVETQYLLLRLECQN